MDYAEEDLIANHLLAMCLAERVKPTRPLIEEIVKDCNSDIRKSILTLQYLFDQWAKPSYNTIDSVIEDLSRKDCKKDLNNEGIIEIDCIQDSLVDESKGVDLQSKEADSKSTIPIEEDPKNLNVTSSKPESPELNYCVPEESKLQDSQSEKTELQSLVKCELRDVEIEEIDRLNPDSLNERLLSESVVVGEKRKIEENTTDLKSNDGDAGVIDGNEKELEAAGTLKEEQGNNLEDSKDEEDPMVAVVEVNISVKNENQNFLIDVAKV